MNRIAKNLMLAAMLAGFAVTASAQSRYYHIVGDTVRGRSPIYYYDWWPRVDTAFLEDGPVVSYPEDSMIHVYKQEAGYMKHYSSTPLSIVGIASTLSLYDIYNPANPYVGCDTTFDTTMFFTLYDATPAGIVELARVCWTCDLDTHPTRYMVLPRVGSEASARDPKIYCESAISSDIVVPLREYYFDTAINVTDSFYLGWMFDNKNTRYWSDSQHIAYIEYRATHMWYFTCLSSDNAPDYIYCRTRFPWMTYIYDNSDGSWRYRSHNDYLLVFPIIKVDTVGLPYDTAFFSCQTPRSPQVTVRDGIRVRLNWVDNRNDGWEVSLTPPGGDPEAGRIFATANTFFDFYGLSDDSVYSAYVRGHCRNGWGEWSEEVLLTDTTGSGTEGIAELPSGVGFELSPNPAGGTVTVTTEVQQGTVTVIDMQGRQVLSAPVEGTSTVLDLKGLVAGTYLVRLATPQGTATGKLVVE